MDLDLSPTLPIASPVASPKLLCSDLCLDAVQESGHLLKAKRGRGDLNKGPLKPGLPLLMGEATLAVRVLHGYNMYRLLMNPIP